MARVLLVVFCSLALVGAFLDGDEVGTMKAQIAQLQQTINTMQTQLNTTSALAAKAAALPHHSPVAFTAHLANIITNLGTHQHVVFDNIITNVGGAYSKSTGHFTAPVAGYYAFSLTITNMPGHSASLTLMQNKVPKANALAHGTTAGQFETSTVVVVLNLNAADEVWAQNEGSYSTVEELDGYNYSSFTGFLVN